MGAPVWITIAGDLGKIQEAEFYDFQLLVSDPLAPNNQQPTFTVQAGKLPTGLRITREGLVEGYPSCEVYVAGVPSNVGQNVTSRFVIRATSFDGIVDDRTFELTVVGQDAPVILTAEGLLGTYRDGDYVNDRVLATDADPDDTLTFRLLSGTLPPGLSVTSDGYVRGYIEPTAIQSGTPGFDSDDNGFDVNTFDYRTIAENKNFQFTVAVSDGKDTVAATYTIFVYAANTFTADTTALTADMTGYPLTADQTNLRSPVLISDDTDFGTVTHDNYFAYQFVGEDFDGDNIEFGAGVGAAASFPTYTGTATTFSLPSGLTLDADTGWLYGYLPSQAAIETDYTFAIRVLKKEDNDYVSDWKFFTMTVVGSISAAITWITPAVMGTIKVGEISTFAIETTNALNKQVQYRIKSNTNSKLPQGLRLNSDGLLLGRPAFKTMMFDGGTTTFDADSLIIDETTFERTFTFTVEVYDTDGDISTTRTFTLVVDPGKYKPYENLWVRAYPKVAQREIWESLINSPDDFPPDLIYRGTDYHYGKQQDIRFITTTGLSPSTPSDMVEAMAKNHYNKRVALGEIKKARAVRDGAVQYEVVYAEVLDTEENTRGKSPALSIDFMQNHANEWNNPVLVSDENWSIDYDGLNADNEDQYVFYPNSFDSMNQRMIDGVGQVELSSLPLWMRSKQEDGSILGFTAAVVIAYVKPGAADEIIFNISRRRDIDLKKIEFIIDRYIWDNDMSANYDVDADAWLTEAETTFDLSTTETTFDGGGTRFLSDSFQYKETRDEGDQYLKFPRTNIKRELLG